MWNQWMGMSPAMAPMPTALPQTAAPPLPNAPPLAAAAGVSAAGLIGPVMPSAAPAMVSGMESSSYIQYTPAQYAAMTPEQQIALQQHLQQWQNYQQEYAKWHAQYGEQYNREMAAAAAVATPSAPAVAAPAYTNYYQQQQHLPPPPPPPPEEKKTTSIAKISSEPHIYKTPAASSAVPFNQQGPPPPMHLNHKASQNQQQQQQKWQQTQMNFNKPPPPQQQWQQSFNSNQTQLNLSQPPPVAQQWQSNQPNQSEINLNQPPPQRQSWPQNQNNQQYNLMRPPPSFNQSPNFNQSSNFSQPPPTVSQPTSNNFKPKIDNSMPPNRNNYSDNPGKNKSDTCNVEQRNTDTNETNKFPTNQNTDLRKGDTYSNPSYDAPHEAGSSFRDNVDYKSSDNINNPTHDNFRGKQWNCNQNNSPSSDLFSQGNRGNSYEPNQSNSFNRNFKPRQDYNNSWNSNRNSSGNQNENRSNTRSNNFNSVPPSRNMGNFGNSMNIDTDNLWQKSPNNFNEYQNSNSNRSFGSSENFNMNRWSNNNRNDGNFGFNRPNMSGNNFNLNIMNRQSQQRIPELDEEGFDRQFRKWEEQFHIWKRENANHPDREMFHRYEQEFEKQRQRIVERREMMRRRKLEQKAEKTGQTMAANRPNDLNYNRSAAMERGSNVMPMRAQNIQRDDQIQHSQNERDDSIFVGVHESKLIKDNLNPAELIDKICTEKVQITEVIINEMKVPDPNLDKDVILRSLISQAPEKETEIIETIDLAITKPSQDLCVGGKRKSRFNSPSSDDKPKIIEQVIIALDDDDDDNRSDKNSGPIVEIFKKTEGIPGLDLVGVNEEKPLNEKPTELIDLDADQDGPTRPPKVAATVSNQVIKIPSLFDIVVEKPQLSPPQSSNSSENISNNPISLQANPVVANALPKVVDALNDKNLLLNIMQVLAKTQSKDASASSSSSSMPSEQVPQQASLLNNQTQLRPNDNRPFNQQESTEGQRQQGMFGNANPNIGTSGGGFNNNTQHGTNFNFQNRGFGSNFGGNRNRGEPNADNNIGMRGGNAFFNRNTPEGGLNFMRNTEANNGGSRGQDSFCNGNDETSRPNRENPFRKNGGSNLPAFDTMDRSNQCFDREQNNAFQGNLAWLKGSAINKERDEFYHRSQVFDYANSITPKVIDYGHKSTNVALSDNNSSTFIEEFKPIKTFDYGHSLNTAASPFDSSPALRNQQRQKLKKFKNKANFHRPEQDNLQLNREFAQSNEQNNQHLEQNEITTNASESVHNEGLEAISDTEDDLPEVDSPPPPPPSWSAQQENAPSVQSVSTNVISSNDLPITVPNQMPTVENANTITIDEILLKPGRFIRPKKLCIILRGPPGSGKSYIAKLIKEKEIEMGGTNPRVLSIDDYFLIENDYEEICKKTGKKIPKKELLYEYDEDMESTYMTYLIKSYKKTIADNLYDFIIIDCNNNSLRTLNEFYCHAKDSGVVPYIVDLLCDVKTCMSRNVHNRRESDINDIIENWNPTPFHYIKLDISSLLENVVEMEDVENMITDTANADDEIDNNDDHTPMAQENKQDDDSNEAADSSCGFLKSKWENDTTSENLARLDGTNKPIHKRKAATMEDYLQIDDWEPPKMTKDGKKRVRWADIEEKRAQEKMRAIGFVVGQTDWKRMMDPNAGTRALNKTKYIQRTNARR